MRIKFYLFAYLCNVQFRILFERDNVSYNMQSLKEYAKLNKSGFS